MSGLTRTLCPDKKGPSDLQSVSLDYFSNHTFESYILGQRFFSIRKRTSRPEFNPKALADFRVTEWDPTHLLMELYRTSNSYFHRSRLRKEGMLETLNLGQTRPGIFRRYKTKYLFVSDSTLTCYQTQPGDVNQTKPKIKVILINNKK